MKLEFIRDRLARCPFLAAAANWLRRTRDELLNEPHYRSRRKRIALDRPRRTTEGHDVNVILLVVDSLRHDALYSNGYFRRTTPFLDTFDCRLTAISASPWTYPSVSSILTGLYPHNHGASLAGDTKDMVRVETYFKMRDDVLTLPEILRFFGYRVFFSTGIAVGGQFYKYRTGVPPRLYAPTTPADEILGDLGRWIKKRENQRFFAYVQLADLHPPMAPPQNFRHFFAQVKDLPKIDTYDFATEAQRQANPKAFEEYRHHRRLLYDNALRYVDSAIEAFDNTLMRLGLADSTMLMVTADHGEQFWEHADLDAKHFHHVREVCGLGHGDSLYNETILVPLLLRGAVPARGGNWLASTTDIAPTVLDFLCISHKWRFDGQSILMSSDQRPLLSEGCSLGHEKKSLTIGQYKLLYSKDDGIEWLFNLEKDPQELHPITDQAVTSIFVKKLLTILERDQKRRALDTIRKTSRKSTRAEGTA